MTDVLTVIWQKKKRSYPEFFFKWINLTGNIQKFRFVNMLSEEFSKSQNYLRNSGFFAFCKSASVFMPKGYTETCMHCSSWVDILQSRAEHRIFLHFKGHTTGCKERRGWVLPAKRCPLALILNSPGIEEGKLWPLVALGNISHNPWLINIDIWEKQEQKRKRGGAGRGGAGSFTFF